MVLKVLVKVPKLTLFVAICIEKVLKLLELESLEGEKIRSVLLDVDNKEMHSDTELLLMFSSRNELIQNKIIPALNDGKWVVSDRFTDASFAYQGGGRMLSLDRIAKLENWVLGSFKPDLTFLLDISVEIGMTRVEARNAKDRIEQEERAFFERVRSVFIERSKIYPDRIKLINAERSVDEIQTQIQSIIELL